MGFQNNVLLIILSLIPCDGLLYNNYSLIVGTPTNNEELEFYKDIEINYDVIYWKEPGALFKEVEFMVAPVYLEALLAHTKERNIIITLIMRDVQSAFDKQVVKPYTRSYIPSFDWMGYYRTEAIHLWLQDLERANQDIMKVTVIGKTFESRPIIAVKLKHSTTNKTLPKVVIEGGIHGREWISPAFVTYLINEVVHAKTSEIKEWKRLALAYEWLVIPVLNPDGYEYTHTTDRMWRKNRYGNHGIDLNRNFGIEFGTVGAEHGINSERYCGPEEFSEPESRALRAFLEVNKKNLQYYLAFHSFGQYFIIPYAYSDEHLDNYHHIKRMVNRAMLKLRERDGTDYTIGTAAETVGYMASGASTCWAKKHFRIPFVGSMELRDKGTFGFALPPDQILPTCLETMEAFYSFLNESAKHHDYDPDDDDINRGCSMSPVFVIVIINFYLIL